MADYLIKIIKSVFQGLKIYHILKMLGECKYIFEKEASKLKWDLLDLEKWQLS